MKKITKILIFFLSLLLLTSCSSENLELSEKIKAPDNITPPLEGKWKIEDYVLGLNSNLTEKAAKTYLGKEVLIDKKLVAISSNYTLTPSFKVKVISARDYLWQYKIGPDFLGIEDENIKVISVSSADQFFYEFIAVEDEKVIIHIDGGFFYLTKVADKVDENSIGYYYSKDKEKGSLRITDSDDSENKKTGLLIGLKSPVENSLLEEYEYRTMFLRFENRKIKSSYVKKDLFLPRTNGFWSVGVLQEDIDNGEDVEGGKKPIRESKQREILLRNNEESSKNITFLGNDYISLENVIYDKEKDKSVRRLEFYSLDGVNKVEPSNITEILGEDGSKSFYEAMFKEASIINKRELIEEQNQPIDESNFAITRKNGHWDLKGRVNFVEEGKEEYEDFFIRAMLAEDIIGYDKISLAWSELKENIPDAVDTFESPNQEIIVVKTNGLLLVYRIDNGEMGEVPIVKINLEEDEEIIMIEWADGDYSHTWDEEFLKDEFEILEYKN